MVRGAQYVVSQLQCLIPLGLTDHRRLHAVINIAFVASGNSRPKNFYDIDSIGIGPVCSLACIQYQVFTSDSPHGDARSVHGVCNAPDCIDQLLDPVRNVPHTVEASC